ncbi:hypothetical protein DB346_18845 [Verrucomicrobia bacterium LW23]|nr:hypothetical protein DB346_18845 [Verrucomicrobia bacterium LW23]
MAYGSRPTAANPALLAFVLDQSQAMAAMGQSGQTKAEEATRAINRLIYLMAQSCMLPVDEAAAASENPPEPQVEDRASIIVVGYNNGEAAPLLGDTLVNTASAPIRMESDTYEVQAEDGSTQAQTFELPVYMEPVATGTTLAAPAFAVVQEAIAGWCQANQSSFPPVVIHIAAGIPEDLEAFKAEAAKLCGLSTTDGSLLLFHVVVGAEGDADVLLPPDDTYVELPHAKGLADISSELPTYILAMVRKVGFMAEDKVRGALVPGGTAAFDYFLNAVALVITGLAWDEDPAAIAADAAAAAEALANAEAEGAAAGLLPAGEPIPAPVSAEAPAASTSLPSSPTPSAESAAAGDDFILPEPAQAGEAAPLPALPSPATPSLQRKGPGIGVPALPSLGGAPRPDADVPAAAAEAPKSVVPSALSAPDAPDSPVLPYLSKPRALPTAPLRPGTPPAVEGDLPPLTPVRRDTEESPLGKGRAKTVPPHEFTLSDDLVGEARAAVEKAAPRRPAGAPPMPRPNVPSLSATTSASAMGITGAPGLRKIEDLDVRSGATMKMPVVRKSPTGAGAGPTIIPDVPSSVPEPAPSAPPSSLPSLPMAGPPGEAPMVPPMRAPKLPPRAPAAPPVTPGASSRPTLPVGGGIDKDTSSLAGIAPGGPPAPASAPAPAFNAMDAHTVALPQPGWAKKRPPQPASGIPGKAGTGQIILPGSSPAVGPDGAQLAPPVPASSAPSTPPPGPTGAPKGGRMPPITQPSKAASQPAGLPTSPSDPKSREAGKKPAPSAPATVEGPNMLMLKVIGAVVAVGVLVLIYLFTLGPLAPKVPPTTKTLPHTGSAQINLRPEADRS